MKSIPYYALLLCMALSSTLGFSQEVGIQLYSLREQFKSDVEGTLEMISEWGITSLEGGDTYGLPLEEFQALLEQNDLSVVSVGTSFEELRDDPAAAIKRAKDFDAEYIMCPWIPHKNKFQMGDAKIAVEVFNRAGKQIEDAGLTLVYHPHGYEFAKHGSGTLFDYMAEQATNFDFEMDVYWVKHGGADPMTLLNTYPEKFKLMHLKDMKAGVKGNHSGHEDVETNVALGTGTIDIAALVRRAGELGIPYLFIEDESSRVVQQVPKSLEYIKQLRRM
ncbi:TIM barrel protein [Zeaxanthinibacter sp. PT1]|uniref:sugar phosphate isomerase/epimerase family protein n=1 Tax=Zeaxanthinibacter TaxID=561554 RepID=UPI0023491A9A|nr:TIM barrel protein [Zeaxanthinibacter sp. PT1]MDC6352734.1 TIM barrel protein [Zeaxanthinibacter sp. PT1]